jgi:hypothetical protein
MSGLTAGGFAEVVADRLNVRVAPASDAEVVTLGVADGPPIEAGVGRTTPWQDVYLLDGPV